MNLVTLPSTELIERLTGKILFLDTNVFIGALVSDEFAVFLADLRGQSDVEFLTISSVVYEFTRGSKTLEEFNDKRQFINDLVDRVISVGPLLENAKNDVFSLLMSRLVSSKDSGYTDFLLATCLYQYSQADEIFLMTADQRSMPLAIFDVIGTLAATDGHTLRHYGVYQLNRTHFTSAAKTQPREA